MGSLSVVWLKVPDPRFKFRSLVSILSQVMPLMIWIPSSAFPVTHMHIHMFMKTLIAYIQFLPWSCPLWRLSWGKLKVWHFNDKILWIFILSYCFIEIELTYSVTLFSGIQYNVSTILYFSAYHMRSVLLFPLILWIFRRK